MCRDPTCANNYNIDRELIEIYLVFLKVKFYIISFCEKFYKFSYNNKESRISVIFVYKIYIIDYNVIKRKVKVHIICITYEDSKYLLLKRVCNFKKKATLKIEAYSKIMLTKYTKNNIMHGVSHLKLLLIHKIYHKLISV